MRRTAASGWTSKSGPRTRKGKRPPRATRRWFGTKMANLLEGKVIALTGSGHDDGPAAQVVEEIKKAGGEATANFADVSTMDGGESVIRTALDTYGKLDGLINLAAILRNRMVFNLTEQEWDDVIRVDLKGHFTTIKPAAVLMRQQRYGRIVNYSSVSGLQGNSGQADFGAHHAGVTRHT